MSRRGFTLIEVALVISLMAIVVPGIYLLLRTYQERYAIAIGRMEGAAAIRSLSEELRRDLRAHALTSERASLVLTSADAACPRIEYRLEDTRITRSGDGCGPERTLARHVSAMHLEDSRLELELSVATRPGRNDTTTWVIALAEGK